MGTYRRMPVVVDAWKATHDMSVDDLVARGLTPVWVNITNGMICIDADMPSDGEWRRSFCVQTFEGWSEVSPGDYIVTGVAGEIYPCKPEIFEATYEPWSEASVVQTRCR